jgi:hypothetical protein
MKNKNIQNVTASHPDVWWGYECYSKISLNPVMGSSGYRTINDLLDSLRRTVLNSEKFKDEYPSYNRIEITRFTKP